MIASMPWPNSVQDRVSRIGLVYYHLTYICDLAEGGFHHETVVGDSQYAQASQATNPGFGIQCKGWLRNMHSPRRCSHLQHGQC